MMGSEGDLEVKMRVVLDDEDMRKQAAEAERKVNAAPRPPAAAPPMPQGQYKDLASAIAGAMRQQQAQAAGKFEGFGQLALPLAATALGLHLLNELKEAIRSVINNLMALAASLSRFSPELSVAMRSFAVQMRLLSIDMGRVLGPALADLTRALADLIRVIYEALKPLLTVVIGLIRGAALTIRLVTHGLKLFAAGLAGTYVIMAKLMRVLSDLLFALAPQVAAPMRAAAAALERGAKAWIDALSGRQSPENLLNMLLIRGLTEAAAQRSPMPSPSENMGRRVRVTPPREPAPRTNRDGSPSAVAGRVPVQSPAPKLASFVTNVKHSTEVRLESELAVTRAMEEVRRILTSAVLRVRNDQLMLSNRLAAETVVDLVA